MVRNSSPSPSQQPESHTAHHPVTSLSSRPSTFPSPVHPGPAPNLLAVLQRGQAQSHQQDTVLAVPSQGDVLPQMCTWLTPSSPRLYPNIAGGGLPDGPTPYLIFRPPVLSIPCPFLTFSQGTGPPLRHHEVHLLLLLTAPTPCSH